MDGNTSVYCPTCFAMPGESCRSKFISYGDGEVMPVISPTHGSRIADNDRAQFFLSQKAPQ